MQSLTVKALRQLLADMPENALVVAEGFESDAYVVGVSQADRHVALRIEEGDRRLPFWTLEGMYQFNVTTLEWEKRKPLYEAL